MAITRAHLIGAAAGFAAAAGAFYLYKKNQDLVDSFLREHGLDIPVRDDKPLENMNEEELATLKERIEDLLAEREVAAKEKPAKKVKAAKANA